MAALLVAIGIMAVMMTVAMPVWKQSAQREKEEELVFRGEQYARAIGLFQRKFANAVPPNIDVLVQQHFLRKKYKDPITNDDFVPLSPAQIQGGTATAGSTTPGGSTTGRGSTTAGPGTSPTGRGGTPGTTQTPGAVVGGAPAGGVAGVTSKSTATSIRLYKNRSHYNEWQFVYTPPQAAPGTGGAGGQNQNGRGGAGQPGGGRQNGPTTSPTGRGNTPTGRGGAANPLSMPGPRPGR